MPPQAKKAKNSGNDQNLERGRKKFFPRAVGGSKALLTP